MSAPRANVVGKGPTGRESSHGMGEDDRLGGVAEITVTEGLADLVVVVVRVVSTSTGIGFDVLVVV